MSFDVGDEVIYVGSYIRYYGLRYRVAETPESAKKKYPYGDQEDPLRGYVLKPLWMSSIEVGRLFFEEFHDGTLWNIHERSLREPNDEDEGRVRATDYSG